MTAQEIANVIRKHAESIYIDWYGIGEREAERLAHTKESFDKLAATFEEYSK